MNYIEEYTKKVESGEIIAGQWIKRLLDHIKNGLENELFVFDEEKANDVIDWIESHCFHTEGPLAPGPLLLELWQKAIISMIYGIKDINTGNRQFREVVLIVSRKNGKSLFASAIAKYTFFVDGGYGAKVFCLAPKLEQADIIYNNVWQMVQLDPEWQALKLEIEQSKDEHNKKTADDSMLARHRQTDLFIPGTNSTVKKIAFAAKKSDGFNPSLTICDEIASWEGDRGLKQYEAMKSGMGARPEGLIISCSTSGYINDSIYDELVKRCTSFLKGTSRETRLLPIMYMIDDVEKWDDINELRKSNPNLGISVTEDYLKDEIAVAEVSMSKKREFIVKYCNIKQNSSLAWLDATVITKAKGAPLRLEDYRNKYCCLGLDLSQTTDLTAGICLIEQNGIINVFAKFWLPAGKIQEATERDGLPYQMYIQRGLLAPSGDNFVDYKDCYKWFTDLVEIYHLYPQKVGYDRYSASYLIQDLNAYGFQTDDVYQGDNLWPVLQEMEGLFKDGKINIGDNDLLMVHLLNAAIKMSVERGRGKLVKISPNAHIDGVAALADAFCVRQKWWSEIGERLQNRS